MELTEVVDAEQSRCKRVVQARGHGYLPQLCRSRRQTVLRKLTPGSDTE